jgi:hypothetical protein
MNEWMNDSHLKKQNKKEKKKKKPLQGSSWFWAFQKDPSYHHFGLGPY